MLRLSISADLTKAPYAGRYKFLRQLVPAMQQRGVAIVDSSADVHLYLPSHNRDRSARLNVLRLDGLYMGSTWRERRENARLRRAIRGADATIFQTDYCRRVYERFLGVRCETSTVIHNGADPALYRPRNPRGFLLANSSWGNVTKRSRETIDGFLCALERGLDADLVLTADPGYRIEHPRIRYPGWCDERQLIELFSGAIAQVHLSWGDWCPNAMIEAIVAGCPVVYAASGGQVELGRDAGFAVPDIEWNFTRLRNVAPPPMDPQSVAAALCRAAAEPIVPNRPDLNIDAVADRYVRFFQDIADTSTDL